MTLPDSESNWAITLNWAVLPLFHKILYRVLQVGYWHCCSYLSLVGYYCALYSGYLDWGEKKAILACVSQFNGNSSCPEALVLCSCILRIEPTQHAVTKSTTSTQDFHPQCTTTSLHFHNEEDWRDSPQHQTQWAILNTCTAYILV